MNRCECCNLIVPAKLLNNRSREKKTGLFYIRKIRKRLRKKYGYYSPFQITLLHETKPYGKETGHP